jgi:Predicted AAA-ATPase
MEIESKKIQLYNKFTALKSQDMVSNSENWATGEGINNCLVEVFGNDAHIIHPNLFSMQFPINREKVSGIISYIENIQQIIAQDGGVLSKPVIAIWNSSDTRLEQKISSLSFRKAHWQTLVIIPKNYITFNGRVLRNVNELVFFKDPYYQGKCIPEAFKNLLINQNSLNSVSLQGLKIGGIISNAKFHDTKYINVKQQRDEFSSGWWAVYNAVMFVMTGGDDFMENFSSITENLDNKLRNIFETLELPLNDVASYEKRLEENNKNIIDEEFQNSTDNLKFELYSVLRGIHNEEAARKFQINSRQDLIYYPSPDSFEILLHSDVHVDKTLFIKEVIDSGPSNNILITRPRRWGKTLNLQMLKVFFEIEVNEEGKFNLENPNKNRELFEGVKLPADTTQKKLLEKLNIAKVNNGEYLSHQGQYPVIFITFSNVRQDNPNDLDNIDKDIRSSIARAFKDHIFVLNGLKKQLDEHICKIREKKKHLPDAEITKLINIHTNEEEQDILTFRDYLNQNSKIKLDDSLFFLSGILRNYFKKKVYVLIDEYDAPLNSSFGDNCYDPIKNLMKAIIGKTTKNNENVYKAIITGILRISKASLFSGSNNLIECGVLDSDYSEFFGFTDQEVNKLLSTCLVAEETEYKLQSKYIKMCYNGYKIGKHIIYNPWSIMRCLKKASSQPLNALQPYWADSGDFNMIKTAFSKLANVKKLKPLIKNYIIECSISELVDLRYIGESINDFLSLLLQSGYLTTVKIGKYRIPNLEVSSYFYHSILPVWIEQNIGSEKSVNKLVNSAINRIENGKEYKQVIENQLLVLIGQSERTEFDFQILLGAPSMLAFETKKTKHAPYSEVYTPNQKKIDTLFLPIEGKSNAVIIHEYKKALNEGMTINEVLEDAMWQIYANQYISKPIYDKKLNTPKNDYWEIIIVRAIAFFKKKEGTWGVEIQEFVHNFNQAERLNDVFSFNGKLLKNSKELVTKNNTAITFKERKEFLSKNAANNLYELINRYTDEVASEGLIKKNLKIESEDGSILRIERKNLEQI